MEGNPGEPSGVSLRFGATDGLGADRNVVVPELGCGTGVFFETETDGVVGVLLPVEMVKGRYVHAVDPYVDFRTRGVEEGFEAGPLAGRELHAGLHPVGVVSRIGIVANVSFDLIDDKHLK